LNGPPPITSEADLLRAAPDIIIEAASREAVREWGDIALRVARRFVVASTGAFVDDPLLNRLRKTAKRCGSQLVLSSGALAGVEALSAASRMGLSELKHRIVKPPRSWGSLPHTDDPSLERLEPLVLFRGSAREAAGRYPLNANVTIVSALASVGLDRTVVELVSDPSVAGNRHEIHASGDFGSLDLVLENRPIEANPKSSVLAALALIRYAENQVSEFVI
jgi:aspartate dehydrogenase